MKRIRRFSIEENTSEVQYAKDTKTISVTREERLIPVKTPISSVPPDLTSRHVSSSRCSLAMWSPPPVSAGGLRAADRTTHAQRPATGQAAARGGAELGRDTAPGPDSGTRGREGHDSSQRST